MMGRVNFGISKFSFLETCDLPAGRQGLLASGSITLNSYWDFPLKFPSIFIDK